MTGSPFERRVGILVDDHLKYGGVSFHTPGKTVTKVSKLPGNLVPMSGESWETFSDIWCEPGTG